MAVFRGAAREYMRQIVEKFAFRAKLIYICQKYDNNNALNIYARVQRHIFKV